MLVADMTKLLMRRGQGDVIPCTQPFRVIVCYNPKELKSKRTKKTNQKKEKNQKQTKTRKKQKKRLNKLT